MDSDTALLLAFDLGMDDDGWTDAVMDEAARLLPILIAAGYAAEDEHRATWWFTENGVSRYAALEAQAADESQPSG